MTAILHDGCDPELARKLEKAGFKVAIISSCTSLTSGLLAAVDRLMQVVGTVAIQAPLPHQLKFLERGAEPRGDIGRSRLPPSATASQFKHLARGREHRPRKAQPKGKGR